ncbi:MAG: hypothetical protein OEV73_07275 [Desulfobulbaceae bacterium]|nr:hypothetical protein [Desulfobulbaceae bacterium]
MAGVFVLTTLIALNTQPVVASDAELTPEQRRQQMLEELLKLSPEERAARQKRYKEMSDEERRLELDKEQKQATEPAK